VIPSRCIIPEPNRSKRDHYDRWRRMRRAAHEGLHKSAAKAFNTIQMTEAILLANGILESPDVWEKHMRRFTASLIMTAVYDTPAIHSLEDESVQRINDHVMRVSLSILPGSHWVEVLPWMKHIPSRCVQRLRLRSHVLRPPLEDALADEWGSTFPDSRNGRGRRRSGSDVTLRCSKTSSRRSERRW
jgi:hypothetical protein